MKISSKYAMVEGDLSAWKTFDDGSKELIFEYRNLITRQAKLTLLSSLYDQNFVPDRIASFKLGLGGTVDPNGLFPKTEDYDQADLWVPYMSIPTTYVVDEANVRVTYLADLNSSQGNGKMINEAGLFKTSGAIFNVKNFPSVPKTSEFGLHFEWSIKAV